MGNYFFPNQISYIDQKLYIADTNNNSIKIASAEDKSFGDIIAANRVVPDLDINRWVFSFAKVENTWWVNNMNNQMAKGKILVFDDKWEFIEELSLPFQSDPTDIRKHGDLLVISDYDNSKLYFYNQDREREKMLLPSQVETKLNQIKKQKNYFYKINLHASYFLFIFILSGFMAAFVYIRLKDDPSIRKDGEGPFINIDDPDIVWLDKNPRYIWKVWLIFSFWTLLYFIFSLQYLVGPPTIAKPYMLWINLTIIPGIILVYRHITVQLGYLNDMVILKKSARKYIAGTGEQIYYSDRLILIDKLYFAFSIQQSLFRVEQIVEKIMPRLKNANYVTPGVMTNMLLKRVNLFFVLLFVVFIASFYYFY